MKTLIYRIENAKLKTLIIAVIAVLAAIIISPALFSHLTDLKNYTVKVNASVIEYTGKDITPKVKVTNGPISLEHGEDYSLEYEENKDVGEAKVKVSGEGVYKGEISTEFTIQKAKQKITGEKIFEENIADNINLQQTASTPMIFESSDDNIATIDSKGTVHAYKPGDITIAVKAQGNEFYEEATKELSLTITETQNQKTIRETLEWARMIADDDSYTYGHGQCPKCHNTRHIYDCIGFMTAAFWHGGKVDMMERWCTNHNYIDRIRQAMKDSEVWKGIGNPKIQDLQPGDVLFYYRAGDGKNGSGWFHVETYYGDGKVVGAHTFGGKRCISVEPWNNYFRSYRDVYRYVGN